MRSTFPVDPTVCVAEQRISTTGKGGVRLGSQNQSVSSNCLRSLPGEDGCRPPVRLVRGARTRILWAAENARVVFEGELDLTDVAAIRAKLIKMLADDVAEVVIDLRKVGFVDLTVAQAFIDAAVHATRQGAEFSIVEPPRSLVLILEALGVVIDQQPIAPHRSA